MKGLPDDFTCLGVKSKRFLEFLLVFPCHIFSADGSFIFKAHFQADLFSVSFPLKFIIFHAFDISQSINLRKKGYKLSAQQFMGSLGLLVIGATGCF